MNRTGSSDYVARRRFLQNQAQKRGLSLNYFTQKAHESNPSLPKILLCRAAQNQLEPNPHNTSFLNSKLVTFNHTRGSKSLVGTTRNKLPVKNLVSNLKRFINTTLGELWEEQGDTLDDVSLFARREEFDPARLPVHVITAGVDVQQDRLEFSVYGFGQNEESWCIEHVIVPGDTARPDVWEDLADELKAAGVEYAAIDSGYNTSFVYEFCEKRKWCYPTKGVTGAGRPLIEDELKRRQRLRKANKRGSRVEPSGVDQGKTVLFSRFRQPNIGPGYVHFRQHPSQDEEFFQQLAAEKLVAEIKGGRRVDVWKSIRARNEALDCAESGQRPGPGASRAST